MRRPFLRNRWAKRGLSRLSTADNKSLLERAKLSASALWTFIGLVASALVVLVVSLEVLRERVIIEEFAVPEEFAKQGWTGRVAAKQMLDQLNLIQIYSTTRMERIPLSSSWVRSSPDLVIAGSSVSISTLAQHLQELLGRDTKRIEGEVTVDADEIFLVVRIAGLPGKRFSASMGEGARVRILEALLFDGAQHVFGMSQPHILASFLCETEDQECVPAIERCLRNQDIRDDAWAYNLWGMVLVDAGNHRAAVEKFERAIELDSKFDLAYGNWGRLLLRRGEPGDFEEATSKFKMAVSIRESADAYANWGLALMLLGHKRQAVEKLEQSLALDPRYVNAYTALGALYENSGDPREAMRKYRTAILIAPDFLLGYEYLASLLAKADPAEAEKIQRDLLRRREEGLRERIIVNPNSGMSHFRLASLLEDTSRYVDAEDAYRLAIRLDDSRPESFLGLGRVLMRKSRYDEAILVLRKAIELEDGLAPARALLNQAISKLEH